MNKAMKKGMYFGCVIAGVAVVEIAGSFLAKRRKAKLVVQDLEKRLEYLEILIKKGEELNFKTDYLERLEIAKYDLEDTIDKLKKAYRL